MPALSKKQQRFFGIVRAIQKGEQAPTTPETAKAARDMKKGDVKDFASTKHKGLPEKKVSKESVEVSEAEKKLPLVKMNKKASDLERDGNSKSMKRRDKIVNTMYANALIRSIRKKKLKEETDYKSRDKIMKKANPLHKHLYKNLLKKDTSGDVNEESKYDRYDSEKKKFAKTDKRMKFGKFYDKAKEAKNRLRPGEVKRYDKKLGKYVSNKD